MFLRVEMSIIKNTTFDHHAMSRNFKLYRYTFYREEVAVVLALYYTLANTSRIHINVKSFEHFHQLKQKCLWNPQVNVRAANNIYSHRSHAIKFKKTAKTNKFLHRIHALKNKAKDIFCVAD